MANRTFAASSSADLDQKIVAHYKQQPEKVLNVQEIRRILEKDAQKGDVPLPDLVSALTNAKLTKDRSLRPILVRVKEQHQKLTFRSLYPDTFKYVRGVDYHQKICDVIDDVLSSLDNNK